MSTFTSNEPTLTIVRGEEPKRAVDWCVVIDGQTHYVVIRPEQARAVGLSLIRQAERADVFSTGICDA